jgi:NitT/TauT family transport system permease protein
MPDSEAFLVDPVDPVDSVDSAKPAKPAKPKDWTPAPGQLDAELAGLDALELSAPRGVGPARRLWSATWPKLAAIAVAVGLWQLAVTLKLKPSYVLPGPGTVWDELVARLQDGTLLTGAARTLTRAGVGFAVATLIGGVVGLTVARSKVLRAAVGSLITGLQTMPSIAWFPLAILLFKLSESAILFVVLLGAAPSIANGIIAGVDHVPPILSRVGTVLGATGLRRVRFVVLPASMPQVVAGLKQGWAFAWRSLMAGELLVIVANQPSIGTQLQVARDLSDAPRLIATMLVILVIGIAVDAIFGAVERGMLRRRGLAVAT